MSDGQRSMVINPNERAISTDINRLQTFIGTDLNELYRQWTDSVAGAEDLDGGAKVPLGQHFTQNSPNSAQIYAGLGVTPDIGTLNLFVDPGVIMMVDPDSVANPDDSAEKFIRDPGMPQGGPTTIATAPNSSGSTRIDVIECARVASPGYVVLETDNRDIFDPISGLFTATTVNKVTAARLQYRVRQGTPGAGFPGTATGWVPLAVASVPTGTTTNDTVTFWDVRPMLSDRARGPSNITFDFPVMEKQLYKVDTVTSSGHSLMSGLASAISTSGRRLGGRMRRSSPDTAAEVESLDLRDSNNQDNAGLSGTGFYYVYALEPFGLPRWCRYTNAADSVRKPRSPRGMILASNVAPTHLYGTPSTGITLPASWGLGSTTVSTGVCIAVGRQSAGVPLSLIADGRVINGFGGRGVTLSPATLNAAAAFFTLQDGTSHPANAKALWVLFTATFNVTGTHVVSIGGGDDTFLFTGVVSSLSNPIAVMSAAPNWYFTGASSVTGMTSTGLARVPILGNYPGSGANKSLAWNAQIFDITASAGITPTSVTAEIVGVEI